MERFKFLFTGPNAMQQGATEEAFEARRIAVVRGQVITRDGDPLPGVTVTIKDHPEFGRTLSRNDSWYDLAVNGGGYLVLEFNLDGWLPAQRPTQVPWNDFAIAETAALIQLDQAVTTIDLTDTTEPFQSAQGSPVTDEDGTRRATVLFPQGVTAAMTLADGTQQALTTINFRATEYTVGPNGPQAMPAPLPPASGYTYAVELSADEVIQAGAKRIDFDMALPCYVDNFLNFPVGEIVPAGWYDYDKAAWIPSDNGRVIAILRIENGSAVLAVSEEALEATAGELEELGITEDELVKLAGIYTEGQSLWRTPVTHFTPWDFNWPFAFPDGAVGPEVESPLTGNDGCPDGNCPPIDGIEAESQALNEDIPMTGSPYSLHYRSDRVPGRKTGQSIKVEIIGDEVPAPLEGVELTATVAGQQQTLTFPAEANQTHTFLWDGLDAYDREVQGGTRAKVDLTYKYKLVQVRAGRSRAQAFGEYSDPSEDSSYEFIGERGNINAGLKKTWVKNLNVFNASELGLGGWSLSVHHFYDPVNRALYLGDGRRRSAKFGEQLIETVAGGGGGPIGSATNYTLRDPYGFCAGAGGDLYISEYNGHRVNRVDSDGYIHSFAGLGVGNFGFDGDGGPAVEAKFRYPADAAVGPDGSVYILDRGNGRVRKVDTNGIINTVAGNGEEGYSGDGGLAVEASFYLPYCIAVGPDSSLYIADYYNNRIRRVTPAGIIDTVAGDGTLADDCPDGTPAVDCSVYRPEGLYAGPDGGIYIAITYKHLIRKVDPSGIITTLAGTGESGYSGDGGPAVQAKLNNPRGLTLGADGSIYFVDGGNCVIRRISSLGVISTVAGNGEYGFSGDGNLATLARLKSLWDVAMGPDGNLYVSDHKVRRIRKISNPFPGAALGEIAIPDESGSQVYIFDPAGHHLRTMDAITGQTLLTFEYDENNHLKTLTDLDGDVTTIERDGTGQPQAIIGPDSHQTTFERDNNGYLTAITNPAGETYNFEYTTDGLITKTKNPRGREYTYEYDEKGRLLKGVNPLSGSRTTNRTETEKGYQVTAASPEGRITNYQVEHLDNGDLRRINTFPDGTIRESLKDHAGKTTLTLPDGTTTEVQKGTDPRFGLLAPIMDGAAQTTPSGLTMTASTTRSVELSDENDIFSHTKLTNTATINGKTTTTEFITADRTWTTTSPEGRQATVIQNEKGRPITYRIPGLEDVNLTYDDRGRLTAISQGEGTDQRTTTMAYNETGDQKGRLATINDALNRTMSYNYDQAGRVTRQTLPDGREVNYEHDQMGNLVSITPPGKTAHIFDYTAMDQTSQYTPPTVPGVDQPATYYYYNKDKQLTKVTRPDGKEAQLNYNPESGKMETLVIPRGTYTYTYQADGDKKLESITAPDGGQISYTYDGSLTTEVTWSGTISGEVSEIYNNDFQVESQSVNGENVVNFGYDQDGLLTQVGDLVLTRDQNNGMLIGTMINTLTTEYSYNDFGEMVGYQANNGSEELYNSTYSRDKLGRIETKSETVLGTTTSRTYVYDQAGRLEQVKEGVTVLEEYTYDTNGNRTSVTKNGQTTIATYDDQDRLMTYGDVAYTYTDNGELATKTDSEGTTVYNYDLMGNLTYVQLPDGTEIEYIIDGQNRRIGKKVNGTLVQGFIYQDQLNPAAELDGEGNVFARFIYGENGHVPAYMIKDGVTYRIISDHLGSTRLVVDVDTGYVAQRRDYDAWGTVVLDTNPGFVPFGFAGGIEDAIIDHIRFGLRDYCPEKGRWTTKDIIGFQGGESNLYGYVLNDPINALDPFGLNSMTWARWAIPAAPAVGPTLANPAIAAAIAAGAVILWPSSIAEEPDIPTSYERSKSGNQDPPWVSTFIEYNPGRGPDGKCRPCRKSRIFRHLNQQSHACRGHQIKYKQDPITCRCYPYRVNY